MSSIILSRGARGPEPPPPLPSSKLLSLARHTWALIPIVPGINSIMIDNGAILPLVSDRMQSDNVEGGCSIQHFEATANCPRRRAVPRAVALASMFACFLVNRSLWLEAEKAETARLMPLETSSKKIATKKKAKIKIDVQKSATILLQRWWRYWRDFKAETVYFIYSYDSCRLRLFLNASNPPAALALAAKVARS
jgi:hypothetical protein